LTYLLFYFLLASVTAFILCGGDKRQAIRRGRRIPERTLLLTGFFGGASGLLLGMLIFRHKIRHLKFLVLAPLFMILQIAILLLLYRQYGLLP